MANLDSTVEISTTEEHGVQSEMTHRRILHRVPLHLRENKTHLYDPVIVSLGPYHHGKSQFRQVEELKEEILHTIFHESSAGGGSHKDKGFFLNKILERVDEIRNFYGGVSSDEYNDEALAEMMLRDGCFVLYSMEMVVGDESKHAHIVDRLGQSAVAFICRDFLLLENQIPFWIINLLIISLSLGEALIYKFLSIMNFGDERLKRVPWGNRGQEPLHLLEAHRLAFIKEEESSTMELEKKSPRIFKSGKIMSTERSSFGMSGYPYCSVTELTSKGRIRFCPSSCLLKDIGFSPSGVLHLPVLVLNTNAKVFLSNVIALEMSPANYNSLVISSYVNFMKSVILKPKDVKELRERGILVNRLGNDNDVVKMFEEISIDGMNKGNIFRGVYVQMYEHFQVEFSITISFQRLKDYFRENTTIFNMLTSVFGLWLSVVQTIMAINQNPGRQN